MDPAFIPFRISDFFFMKDPKPLNFPRGYPYSDQPPMLTHQTPIRKTIKTKTGQSVIGVYMNDSLKKPVKPKYLNFIRDYLKKCWKHDDLVCSQIDQHFTRDAYIFCIANRNFEVGEQFHQFHPIQHEERVYYRKTLSYHRLADNFYAVYYDEYFLAGLCYAPGEPCFEKRSIEYHKFLIWSTFLVAEPYPLKQFRTVFHLDDCEVYGRFCDTVLRRVQLRKIKNKVYHLEFDVAKNSEKLKFCKECMEDYYTHERMERNSVCLPKSLEDQLADEYLNFARSTLQQPITILVFNKTTGKLLEPSKWPKPSDLINFLESNPDCNVHLNSALVAKVVLGEEYLERIEGGSLEAEEAVEVVENLIDLQSARELPPTPNPMELTCARLEQLGLSDWNLDSIFTNSTSNSRIQDFSSSSPSIFHDCNNMSPDENYEFVTDC
ncbi:unnamed protein product [Caenorhabditis brenneri]